MPRALDAIGARLALRAIRFYQRYLSPIKGFSCALRQTTGGASCSAYGYRMIERHGLRLGLALLDARLACCGEANRARRTVPNPLLQHQRGECGPDCDCDLPSARGCFGYVEDVLDILSCCDCGTGKDRRERRHQRQRAREMRKQKKND